MAGKSYGVVLTNGQTGVFDNWDSAKEFIATCPSNAKYKSFKDKKQAEDYIAGLTESKPEDQAPAENSDSSHAPVFNGVEGIAYVDGSFNAKQNQWGYGVVLYDPKFPNDKREFSGFGTAYAESRNVTGEVYGAMVAVKNARKLGMTRITIYHDYAGIGDWITGAWEAKTEMTQKYKAYMQTQMQYIEIKFVKVAGHTGVKLNERCDVLAKLACGVN